MPRLGLYDPIYFDLNCEIFYKEINSAGIHKLVSLPPKDIDWNIKKETRITSDYELFKAEAMVDNNKGGKTKLVAWFSPDLPPNFGPGLFNDLPGMITDISVTELQAGIHYSMKAEKITLKNDLSLQIPLKDLEVITDSELQAIFRKMNSNFRPD